MKKTPMARRIVEEKLSNGSKQYRVEINRIFGIIPFFWHTDQYLFVKSYSGLNDEYRDAIFLTKKEARDFIKHKEWKEPKVIDKKVVE